jgi:hypothetical protein
LSAEGKTRRTDANADGGGSGPSAEDAIRKLRAIEVLEQIGTAEARQVLQALADLVPNPRVAEAATAALERLARRAADRP